MAKLIILYNLKENVTDEEYKKYCEERKGDLILGLPSTTRYACVKILAGLKGNGNDPKPPEEIKTPFKYIGVQDVSSLEAWDKDFTSKTVQEDFLPEWLSKYAADYYILMGDEVWSGGK